jgi:hypothetical protein
MVFQIQKEFVKLRYCDSLHFQGFKRSIMRITFLLLLSSLFIIQNAFGQPAPCKSYPMNGYTGSCPITVIFSVDGKFIYTSDMVTLKKWDIESKTVIEEIAPFPYKLVSNTNDPRIITVNDKHIEYNLTSRTVVDKEKALLNRLNADGKKALAKWKKISPSLEIFFDRDSTISVIIVNLDYGRKSIHKVDLATSKYSLLASGESDFHYNPEMNTFFERDRKGNVTMTNIPTGKQVRTTNFEFENSVLSPDKKYLVSEGHYNTLFNDSQTGKEIFRATGGKAKFKSDGSSVFIYSTDDVGRLFYTAEFSIPDFKQLTTDVRPPWMEKFRRNGSMYLNPEKKTFYIHPDDWTSNVEMAVYERDIATGEEKNSVSFVYTPNTAEAKIEKDDRDARTRIGNNALEKLATMKTPPIVHAVEPYVHPKIADYSDKGEIVVYSNYGGPYGGGTVVIWSFPDGLPTAAYRDKFSTDQGASVAAGAVLVPGFIKNAKISPAGKIVALETSEGILFYEGEVQKSAFPKRILLGLLDNAAVLSDNDYKDIIVIDPFTGKTIGKVNTKGSLNVHTRIKPGVFVITEKERIGILDPASPSEIKFTPVAQLAENDPARYNLRGGTVTDNATGKVDLASGIKPTFTDSHVQSNFLIAYYYNEGFYIYDLRQKKTINEKAIYPGWMNDDKVVFLSGINKLLVWLSVPVFTRPNATDQDPGASAFTIDIATGEVTPYLMTEPRSSYVAKENAIKAEAFRYASLPCEEKKRDFNPGDNIGSTKDHPRSIVLGYDCDLKAYVVARRSLLNPGSNSTVQVSRLFAVTDEELRLQGYIESKKVFEVCPRCHGYPLEFSKQTTSGWSDWEQKSLNIYLYTRKWETKTEEIGTRCSVCRGEAWVKID